MPSAALLEAIAVTAELCGRTFSEAAARVFASDLSTYPEHQVVGALARCRKECRGLLTVADVVNRLEDGRPGPEEAWAMLPKTEAESAVWTAEMSKAFCIASRLIDAGDLVAARVAFKEAYQSMVVKARDLGRPVEWAVTLGHDVGARERALLEAADRGYITIEKAREFAPALPAADQAVMEQIPRLNTSAA